MKIKELLHFCMTRVDGPDHSDVLLGSEVSAEQELICRLDEFSQAEDGPIGRTLDFFIHLFGQHTSNSLQSLLEVAWVISEGTACKQNSGGRSVK